MVRSRAASLWFVILAITLANSKSISWYTVPLNSIDPECLDDSFINETRTVTNPYSYISRANCRESRLCATVCQNTIPPGRSNPEAEMHCRDVGKLFPVCLTYYDEQMSRVFNESTTLLSANGTEFVPGASTTKSPARVKKYSSDPSWKFAITIIGVCCFCGIVIIIIIKVISQINGAKEDVQEVEKPLNPTDNSSTSDPNSNI